MGGPGHQPLKQVRGAILQGAGSAAGSFVIQRFLMPQFTCLLSAPTSGIIE